MIENDDSFVEDLILEENWVAEEMELRDSHVERQVVDDNGR